MLQNMSFQPVRLTQFGKATVFFFPLHQPTTLMLAGSSTETILCKPRHVDSVSVEATT